MGVLVALIGYGADAAAQNEVREPRELRYVLECDDCVMKDMPEDLLSLKVVDARTVDAEMTFVVAFWTSLDPKSNDPLHVLFGDRFAHQWRHTTFQVPREIDRARVASVQLLSNLVFVNLDYSIDDYAIPVFTSELQPLGVIYGRVKEVLPGGVVLYDPHQPHFGPHDVRLGVFDPTTGKTRDVFPPQTCQPVRCRYSNRMEKMLNIQGGTPFIETRNPYPRAVNWSTRAVAFAVFYEQWYPMTTPKGWTETQMVMAVCRNIDRIDATVCEETPFDAWRKAFPGVADAELVARAAANPLRVRP